MAYPFMIFLVELFMISNYLYKGDRCRAFTDCYNIANLHTIYKIADGIFSLVPFSESDIAIIERNIDIRSVFVSGMYLHVPKVHFVSSLSHASSTSLPVLYSP